MRSLIVLAALLACAMSANIPHLSADLLNGKVFDGVGNGKIVGGAEVVPHSLPFQVRLESVKSGGVRCGGSVINADTILCAAHCGGFNLTDYQIAAGVHDSSANEASKQIRGIKEFLIHENYNANTNENDIALIFLEQPLDLSKNEVKAIRLPDQTNTDVAAGTLVTVSGWGTTTEGGNVSSVLLSVEIPVVSDADCQRAYLLQTITSSMICAGTGLGDKDSCQGDSGGPLFTGSGADATQWGIVSWGRGCARQRFPGVYTEMTYFTDWVKSKVTLPF